MRENVVTKNGLVLSMLLVDTYRYGKLFYFQERLCITDLDNKEIDSHDIIDLIEEIL